MKHLLPNTPGLLPQQRELLFFALYPPEAQAARAAEVARRRADAPEAR